MNQKTKDEIISAKSPLEQVYEKYFWCDDFPTISEHDNEEVIKNFLAFVRSDTGIAVPRSMVVSVPNWNIFKGPKQITQSRRKPKVVEQEMVVEEKDAAEEQVGQASQEQAAEKERRSKKRSERPIEAKGEEPIRAQKRKKTVVIKKRASDAPQGKISKAKTDSIPVAQSPSPPPIDLTKPLNMILPSPQPSQSSSENTISDSSIDSDEIIRKSSLNLKRKKASKKQPKNVIHLSPEDETIVVDTTILEQPTEPTRRSPSIFYHLTPHLSGDAFAHSNENSPKQYQFGEATPETPQDQPIPDQPMQTPPPSLADIRQENPPSFTPVQDEVMTHSGHDIVSPTPITSEQQPPSTLPVGHTSPEPTPEPIYGPINKPQDEDFYSMLPTQLDEPVFIDILKAAIDIDYPKPIPDLSKISIIEFKPK
jgi:hypothetical protein